MSGENVFSAPMSEIYPVMKEVLDSGGSFRLVTAGNSMKPLLRDRRDTVILERPKDALKKFDILMYRRKNGAFVLHRLMKSDGDFFSMCGDNQRTFERGVCPEWVIARVTGIVRNGKTIDLQTSKKYCLYVFFWCRCFFLRQFCIFIRRGVLKIKRIFGGE